MEKSVVLGIDIGGTNTIYGFITCEGTIVFHNEILFFTNIIDYKNSIFVYLFKSI